MLLYITWSLELDAVSCGSKPTSQQTAMSAAFYDGILRTKDGGTIFLPSTFFLLLISVFVSVLIISDKTKISCNYVVYEIFIFIRESV